LFGSHISHTMLRSLQHGLDDFLDSSSSSEEDDYESSVHSTEKEQAKEDTYLNSDSETDGSATISADGSATISAADDSIYAATLEDEDEERSVTSDDDSTSSRKFRKLGYRLSRDDPRLTEVELDVLALGADADMSELLALNNVVTKLSLVGPAGGTKRHRSRTHQTNEGQQQQESGDEEQQRMYLRNLKVLCKGWPQSTSIQHVCIQNTTLDREVASVLGTALAESTGPLQILTLQNCALVGSGLAVLFVGLQHNPRLQSLVVQACDLRGGPGDVVAATLPRMKLKSLALIDTNLGVEDLEFLCDNVEGSSELVLLNLSHNRLRRRGTKRLVSMLKSPQQRLQKIVLVSCGLDDYCIRRLAQGLAESGTLSSLNLSHNAFGDAGAKGLKHLLMKNHEVKELLVDGCDISKKLVKGISDGLRYNNSFLKSIFSETTSMTIFESVDFIGKLGAQGQQKAAQVVSP